VSLPGSVAPVARLRGVGQRYGRTVALADIDLEVAAGRMVGLIGPDGVGKSSLLALVAAVARLPQSVLASADAHASAIRQALLRSARPDVLAHALRGDEALRMGSEDVPTWELAMQMLPPFTADSTTARLLQPCARLLCWRMATSVPRAMSAVPLALDGVRAVRDLLRAGAAASADVPQLRTWLPALLQSVLVLDGAMSAIRDAPTAADAGKADAAAATTPFRALVDGMASALESLALVWIGAATREFAATAVGAGAAGERAEWLDACLRAASSVYARVPVYALAAASTGSDSEASSSVDGVPDSEQSAGVRRVVAAAQGALSVLLSLPMARFTSLRVTISRL